MKKETKERIITIALTAATFAPLLFATAHGFGEKYSEPLSPVAAEAVAYSETYPESHIAICDRSRLSDTNQKGA